MNLGLTGKRFVIAGATSALGSAIARLLVEEGAGLLLLGRDEEKLAALKASLTEPSSHTLASVDIENNPDGIIDPIVRDAEANGRLSGGVYCPGIELVVPLRALTASQIERVFRVNYVGAQLFVKAIASMKARHAEGGSIVLVGSVAALRGNKGISTYCASKAALVTGTRSLALELADSNIRVNCISPGWFESPMAHSSFTWYPGGRQAVEDRHPLGVGTPNDIAFAATYLLSNAAKWVTGTNLIVDGGYLA